MGMMERLFLRPVKLLLLVIMTVFTGFGQLKAQPPVDTLPRADSSVRADSVRVDSVVVAPPVLKDTIKPFLQHTFTSDSFLYRKRLFYSFTNPIRYTVSERMWEGKEMIFYSVIALLLFFALIKNSFSRYLSDLFSSYFRTTVRQRQVKEQLLQSPLPSLLFNLFFVISGAVFLGLLFRHFHLADQLPFWMLVLYCLAGLGAVYGIKFLLLKFFGWVFQQPEITDSYIFVVFSTNKILGISLLPFIILMAFTAGPLNAAAVTVSVVVVVGLFLYRFFLTYISIQRTVSINFFHFALYLAAFEVLPLLLINKLLFTLLSKIS